MDLLQRAAVAAPAAARTHLDAALRAASEQLWVARTAARIFANHVGDRDAARAVLAALQPLTCREWRLVAAAWCELGDHAAAAACLERAATNARVATDLCIVAMGYRDARFEDEARLLVDGAAQVAHRAIDAWIVASCYRDSFHDASRARAVLDAGLRDAAATTELLTLARAYAAHDAPTDEIAAIVARARPSTVADWIELAVAHQTILLDVAAADRCVNEAARLATTPQDEREIAIARGRLHLELLDDERPKLPPSKLLRPGARSFAWDRDANRLLGWLRARIPRTAINTLSRPDRFFANDDLVTLLELQKTGNVPHPLPAYLDTLDEYRWREGDGVDHQLRAFACTLLAVDDAAAISSDGAESTLAVLLESCLELGPDAVAAAGALFAALADTYEATRSTTRDGYLVLFAELGLACATAWLDPTDPRLPLLVERMIEDEAQWRAANGGRPQWLLGLTRHARRNGTWRVIAQRTLVHPSVERLARYFT